jgi:hypothetical protein
MNQPLETSQSPADLTVVFMLSRLLQRMEAASAVDAQQYRSVVDHLAAEFEKLPLDQRLDALLKAHPAAAEVYENVNYRHAGLCRSPLQASLNGELLAAQVLARASAGRSKTA